ncbi:haloacid dehalogenase type II [Protaetiibacter larvae]|uniref:Haloacid dehalogenase type II n=1 Tax=Protaetiibacter larvae TaxID=2592654 RepID=A0A5C1Y772_9MICO|nr:haloacid dehalogenase type II [Protaetiibacter larvae]QEO09500.1 haloacid dehalogenase type II [Protaetiibacter larvae]
MSPRPSGPLAQVKALTFDVFGTVVDFRSSIIAEGRRLSALHGDAPVDWPAFADQWRAEYRPAMDRVTAGSETWINVDNIYRRALDMLIEKFGIDWLSEEELAEFNLIWHRLEPWGDSVLGLERLRKRFILATLSNGNVRLLVDLARHAKLPWDMVLSSELVRAYKPDRRMYQSAVDYLSLEPQEIMMVAAHQYDLRAAAELGFRTAFVMRPLEHGPEFQVDLTIDDDFDVVANDMVDLARQLGL